jgi:prepilin-type N-terminal cleavage/methylation domain-containing protein
MPVATALPAAIPSSAQATPLLLHSARFRRRAGFTLVELLVTVGVLGLLVLLFTQLLNSAATIMTLGHKQMDADSQARQLLDRMAVDFAQLVKRSDVDFFGKGTTAGGAMTGNDQIAFYSGVPGYYPTSGSQSPVSLVAYRINSNSTSSSYNKLERMGKGLVWNGVSSTDTPVVFMPLTISATWPAATSSSASDTTPSAYEVIGPQVFRFEYCYLLRSNGSLSITPPTDISGIAAIIADIAVIDSKSKVLLTNTQITSLAGQLSDYAAGMAPGQLRTSWQNTLNGITTLPRPAISGIRVYERFFYLSPPTL